MILEGIYFGIWTSINEIEGAVEHLRRERTNDGTVNLLGNLVTFHGCGYLKRICFQNRVLTSILLIDTTRKRLFVLTLASLLASYLDLSLSSKSEEKSPPTL